MRSCFFDFANKSVFVLFSTDHRGRNHDDGAGRKLSPRRAEVSHATVSNVALRVMRGRRHLSVSAAGLAPTCTGQLRPLRPLPDRDGSSVLTVEPRPAAGNRLSTLLRPSRKLNIKRMHRCTGVCSAASSVHGTDDIIQQGLKRRKEGRKEGWMGRMRRMRRIRHSGPVCLHSASNPAEDKELEGDRQVN